MNKENNSSKKIYGTRSEKYKDNRTKVVNTNNKNGNNKKVVPKTNTPKKIVPSNKKKVNTKNSKAKILKIKDLENSNDKLFDIGIDKINLEKNIEL